MKCFLTSLCAVSLCIGSIASAQDATQDAAPKAPKPPQTVTEQGSYGVGYSYGMQMKRMLEEDGIGIDARMLARGILDALLGKKPVLTEAQMKNALGALREMAESKSSPVGTENARVGREFLAKNKTKTGITTRPSGLQYRVLKSGNGPSPKATDRVRTHYRGTLINGKEFDSSIKRGEPAEFPVNGVIAGWTEALQLMKVGDKWQLFIPSELAYGKRGAGSDIGPNSTLIFEVELLDILR